VSQIRLVRRTFYGKSILPRLLLPPPPSPSVFQISRLLLPPPPSPSVFQILPNIRPAPPITGVSAHLFITPVRAMDTKEEEWLSLRHLLEE